MDDDDIKSMGIDEMIRQEENHFEMKDKKNSDSGLIKRNQTFKSKTRKTSIM
jgi:hypothetical protein